MANGLSWNNINANFGDTASLMNAAQQGMSNAGNLFGQAVTGLREREKMELDNAYRERSFDESIRQFEAKFGQDAAQHADKMSLEADKLKQAWDIAVMQDKTNRLKAQADIANAGATRRLAAMKFAAEQQDKLDKRYGTFLESAGSSLVNGDLSNLPVVISNLQEIASNPNNAHRSQAQSMLNDIRSSFDPQTGTLLANSPIYTLREAASGTNPYAQERALQAAFAKWGNAEASGKLSELTQQMNKEQRDIASKLKEKEKTDQANYTKKLYDKGYGLQPSFIRDLVPGSRGNARVVDDFISQVTTLSKDLGVPFSKEAALDFLVRNNVNNAWTDTVNGPFDSASYRIQNLIDKFIEAYGNNEFNLGSSQVSPETLERFKSQLDKVTIANRTVGDQREAYKKREEERKKIIEQIQSR